MFISTEKYTGGARLFVLSFAHNLLGFPQQVGFPIQIYKVGFMGDPVDLGSR